MCVSVCVCVHAHARVHACAYVWARYMRFLCYLFLSVCLSACVFAQVSVCLSVCLSISLSVIPFSVVTQACVLAGGVYARLVRRQLQAGGSSAAIDINHDRLSTSGQSGHLGHSGSKGPSMGSRKDTEGAIDDVLMEIVSNSLNNVRPPIGLHNERWS